MLVVEDATDIREVFTMLLAAEGAEVVATGSGRHAVRLMREEAFDVLLTDLGLPDLPGELVVRHAATAEPRPWIVVVTGYGEPFGTRARAAGADVVLTKPVPWPTLLARLAARPAPARMSRPSPPEPLDQSPGRDVRRPVASRAAA